MVYLGGPRGPRAGGARQIRLHDAPPGYRPPRIPSKQRKQLLRQDQLLLRVGLIVLIPLVAAVAVLFIVLIATHL
jgi:hypothetical protein